MSLGFFQDNEEEGTMGKYRDVMRGRYVHTMKPL